MKMPMTQGFKKGFGLLEAVISIAVVSISLFSLAAVGQISFKASSEAARDIKAGYLAEEGFEALKTIRDNGWPGISSFSQEQDYFLFFSGGSWQATTSPQTIDGVFSRKFVLSPVYRDASDNIVSSGVLDPDSRRAVLTVSWGQGKSRVFITYLTNLFQN